MGNTTWGRPHADIQPSIFGYDIWIGTPLCVITSQDLARLCVVTEALGLRLAVTKRIGFVPDQWRVLVLV